MINLKSTRSIFEYQGEFLVSSTLSIYDQVKAKIYWPDVKYDLPLRLLVKCDHYSKIVYVNDITKKEIRRKYPTWNVTPQQSEPAN